MEQRREARDKTPERRAGQNPRAISPPNTKIETLLGICDLPCERTHHGKGRQTTKMNLTYPLFSLLYNLIIYSYICMHINKTNANFNNKADNRQKFKLQ